MPYWGYNLKLNELNQKILLCSKCSLRGECTQPVCGSGEIGAKYFILGEAPGANEDATGMPFVGLAGKRLDKLIGLAGIDINSCYLTNVCKCRPPTNRTPRKSERLACYPWLTKELAIIKPEIIICLGSSATSLFSELGIRQLHGTMMEIELELDDAL
jgi:uracil-DNA glycosylase